MEEIKSYENYPFRFVLIGNLLSLSIYGLGIFVIAQIGLIWVFFYLLFILLIEYRLLKHSCKYCYYYGKYCAFGKGKLCALFFKKGDPQIFVNTEITWKSLIPDFLVFLIPLLSGIVLLIIKFKLGLLLILGLLFLLGFIGNALIRGNLACKYCKQREIGCPAVKFFSKTP
jgi:hypothetical protein